MHTALFFALAEIAGCVAFRAVMRNGAPVLWVGPCIASRIAFAPRG